MPVTSRDKDNLSTFPPTKKVSGCILAQEFPVLRHERSRLPVSGHWGLALEWDFFRLAPLVPGSWILGGSEAKDKDFKCAKGGWWTARVPSADVFLCLSVQEKQFDRLDAFVMVH